MEPWTPLIMKPGIWHHLPDLLGRKTDSVDAVLNSQQVAEEQQNDPLEWDNILPQGRQSTEEENSTPAWWLQIKRGALLYHNCVLPKRVIQQFVIPRALISTVIEPVHCDNSAAHSSIFRTYCRLHDQYLPQILSDIAGSCNLVFCCRGWRVLLPSRLLLLLCRSNPAIWKSRLTL